MAITFAGSVSPNAPAVYDKTDLTKNPTGMMSTGIGLKGTDQADVSPTNTGIHVGNPVVATAKYDTNQVAE